MSEKILFVDDEENILAAFRRQLRGKYSVSTASNGEEGLETIHTQGPFAIIVADFRMPRMNGTQFLSRAKELAPDSVRIMLTGHADLNTAIEAVNDGNIFRFLTKPCSTENLIKTLDYAIELHRLINAERDLLQKTLGGSVKLFMELLSLSNPIAFSRTLRLRRVVRHIVGNLNTRDTWQIELAAMLSQVGCVALPGGLLEKYHCGEPVTNEERNMLRSHPLIAHRLLERIPRLESVALIVKDQHKDYADFEQAPSWGEKRKIHLGAQILKAALDYDELLQQGLTHTQALEKLSEYHQAYNPEVLEALSKGEFLVKNWKVQIVPASGLEIGMILEDDLLTREGETVAAQGQEITPLILERVSLISRKTSLVEPIRVLIQGGARIPAAEIQL